MASNLEFISSIKNTTENVTTVSFDNIFSDKYDVYYLTVTGFEPATAEELAFRLINSSGSALTGSNYTSPSYTLQTGGSFSEVRDVNQDKWRYGGYQPASASTGFGLSMIIYSPFVSSTYTFAELQSVQSANQYIGRTNIYSYGVAESTRGIIFTNNGNFNMDLLKASVYGIA